MYSGSPIIAIPDNYVTEVFANTIFCLGDITIFANGTLFTIIIKCAEYFKSSKCHNTVVGNLQYI